MILFREKCDSCNFINFVTWLEFLFCCSEAVKRILYMFCMILSRSKKKIYESGGVEYDCRSYVIGRLSLISITKINSNLSAPSFLILYSAFQFFFFILVWQIFETIFFYLIFSIKEFVIIFKTNSFFYLIFSTQEWDCF